MISMVAKSGGERTGQVHAPVVSQLVGDSELQQAQQASASPHPLACLEASRAAIIVPLTATSAQEVVRQGRTVGQSGASDLVEWRLDYLESVSPREVQALVPKLQDLVGQPLLATFRTRNEGGAGASDDWLSFTGAALAGGVDAVDVEATHPQARQFLTGLPAGVTAVVSHHQFQGNGAGCLQGLEMLNRWGAEFPQVVLKLAVMVEDRLGLARVLNAVGQCPLRQAKVGPLARGIMITMGEAGQVGRVFPRLLGSGATFATLAGEQSAPGQVDAQALRDFHRATNCLGLN
ncbi:MAG: type I 3-dehydroquinate dehydratase [Actinomycetaceae bacterium]|nr:type I 3-dehydroquinate dehydratase [Actinomycetaceae bacterium]